MWKATDVEPAFVDKPFASRRGVLLQRDCLDDDRDETTKPDEGCRFLYSFFSRKKLSKMVVERVRGRRTASSRAGTETRTSRSRATMAPTLRPRTPRKGGDASGVTPEGHGTRSRRGTSRDEKSRDGPKARSFALSSSGWLFVYYVGVVKALAERGYHKCVSFSHVARCGCRSPDVVVARRAPLSFKCARISTTDARRGSFSGASLVGSEDARATNRGGDDLVGRPEHRTRRAVPRARVAHRSRFSPVLSLASLPHFHTGAPRCTARAAVP